MNDELNTLLTTFKGIHLTSHAKLSVQIKITQILKKYLTDLKPLELHVDTTFEGNVLKCNVGIAEG